MAAEPDRDLPTALQAITYAIPFSHLSIASQPIFTRGCGLVLAGIAYKVVFTAIVLVIAARFYGSEGVLTARLKLRRGKGVPEE